MDIVYTITIRVKGQSVKWLLSQDFAYSETTHNTSWLLLIVYFGVQKGVERANKIFMPLLFILIFVLVIWSVNLKGAALGLSVYLKPDFSALRTPQIWIDAFSQIFFRMIKTGFGET